MHPSTAARLALTSLTLGTVAYGATLLPGSGMRRVAITKIVDHPSLARAESGAMDALAAAGYREGKNLEVQREDAQGDLKIASQIARQLTSGKWDGILAISTPSAQTVHAANTAGVSVVISSVTDPIAAGLVSDLNRPGGHLTGSMDQPPLGPLLDLAQQVLPQARRCGVIYNSGEANSARAVALLRAAGEERQLTIVEQGISRSMDIVTAVHALAPKVDLIYLPSDNTVWSALETLVAAASQHKVPVMTNDPDSARKGVVLALGYDQYAVGWNAGEKLAAILGGQAPGTLPITAPAQTSLWLNQAVARAVGINLAPALLKQADQVITEVRP